MATGVLWLPDRRDVIWIDCSPHIGQEMKDVHPFLVLSPKAFNERTNLVIGLPMTTAESNETNPFAVKFTGTGGGVSYVLAHQPKSYDWKMRGAKPHKMKQVPETIFMLACESLNQIIAICQ
jgi:mRNA interferase MazF